MISPFLLLLFHAIGGFSSIYGEPTRVYNAKARSPDGSNDMQIQVIQVGLVNFDEEGRRITQPPIPVTVHNEIRHRVTWSPETGVQKIDSPPEEDDDTSYQQRSFNRPENTLFPNFISQYFARTNIARSPTSDSELFIFTVLGLCIGLSIFILFAYFINLCLQRRKKKHEMIITRKIIYRPRFEVPRPPQMPLTARPILYEPEYENLSDLDEAETYIPLPPPLPPRKKRPRPPLHLVLDQPVTWLLEKPSSESSGPGSLVKQKTRQEEEAARNLQRQNYERRKARRIRRGSF
uniref:Uncharacterized protein n=1 Tax=Panagrolaimus sp. PS1159 TaxID=55785 RepID=A0AC35EY12_9BILA